MMRLKINLLKNPKHEDLVSGVAWASSDEVFSTGDDHNIFKWTLATNEASKLVKLPENVYPTDMHWFPPAHLIGGAAKKSGGGNDIFVLASTDGRFHILNKAGRIEKSVDAHKGAVLSSRWCADGTALLTTGEDGQVKIWSRSGMLRSILSQNSYPVYSACWSPESDSVLYTVDRQLVIKSLQTNVKPTVWKAHDGVILKVDWNAVNGHLISSGEDCRYKIWDSYGRNLYTSAQSDFPITSVAWSPDGEMFAVGSFNMIRICDKCGWSHCMEKPAIGSIQNLAWSQDSTQVVGACGNGQVVFASIVEIILQWRQWEALIVLERRMEVRNCINQSVEKLDFRDRIVKASLGWNHLVVATSQQCYVYSVKSWNTPQIFDLKEGRVTLIVQCENYFLLVDGGGLYVFTYEGRLVSSPRQQNMRTDSLHGGIISLCNDAVAVRDRMDEKIVYLFEVTTGKPVGDGKPLTHKVDVVHIGLDQCGQSQDRKLALIDKNMDLYLTTVRMFGVARKFVKIGSMITSMAWCDEVNILAAFSNGKVMFWLYPNVAFTDKDLLNRTITYKDASDMGKQPNIVAFHGNHVVLRRAEGSLVSTCVQPHAAILNQYIMQGKWKQALRLCRYVKDDTLWACLAAMATANKDLDTAEIAYTAVNEVDKVQYIRHIKQLPLKEARNAEMLLLSGNFQDAEGLLLQAGLVFRAIMLNIISYNWERALELAVKHKTALDIVLALRHRYMKSMGKPEKNKKFLQHLEEVEEDYEKILETIEHEYQKEKEVPSAGSGASRPDTSSRSRAAGKV